MTFNYCGPTQFPRNSRRTMIMNIEMNSACLL